MILMQSDATLGVLEKKWLDTCKVLFGAASGEIGSIAKFVPWLTEFNEPLIHRKSSVSGKDVTYVMPEYSEGSKWIGFEEIDYSKKFEPLNINEIKDIDSRVAAVKERIYYAGNVVLGNSGNIERSSNVNDSFYFYECGRLGN